MVLTDTINVAAHDKVKRKKKKKIDEHKTKTFRKDQTRNTEYRAHQMTTNTTVSQTRFGSHVESLRNLTRALCEHTTVRARKKVRSLHSSTRSIHVSCTNSVRVSRVVYARCCAVCVSSSYDRVECCRADPTTTSRHQSIDRLAAERSSSKRSTRDCTPHTNNS